MRCQDLEPLTGSLIEVRSCSYRVLLYNATRRPIFGTYTGKSWPIDVRYRMAKHGIRVYGESGMLLLPDPDEEVVVGCLNRTVYLSCSEEKNLLRHKSMPDPIGSCNFTQNDSG